MSKKFFSVIIPTMWKSDKIHKMLPIYQNNEFVKEIIIIDNDSTKKPNLSLYSKVIYYTKNTNLYVNPSWNLGFSFSNYETILANDDIFISDLSKILESFQNTEYDIIGVSLENKGEFSIQKINNFPENSYGCFMYVKNYTYIPEKYKIWYGDRFLFDKSTKRGILLNCGITTKKSETLNSNNSELRNTIALQDKNVFENDNNFLNSTITSKIKVLVVLVNYGTEQINLLKKVVENLRGFKKYDIKIVVHSNINIDFPEIDEVKIFTLDNYQYLPLTCRTTIIDNKDHYDLFVYGENDMLFEEYHLDRHIEYSKFLPQNRITGLLRFEKDKMGFSYPDYHAGYDWDFNSLEVHNGKLFAHFTNVHQASFIITKNQLEQISKLYDFKNFFGSSKYSVKCKVCTDLFDFCNMKKMICISDFKENLIHHLSNVYVNNGQGRNRNQFSLHNRMVNSLKKLLSSESKVINGFYLNLKKRPDRNLNMLKELTKTKHNILRFEAIDGTNLPTPKNFKPTIPNSSNKQYATFLSHLEMLKIAKKNNWDKLLILEDDIELCNDFDERLDFFLNKLPNDFEIAYLGFNDIKETKLKKIDVNISIVENVFGCFGMVINGNFLDKLINTLETKFSVIDNVIMNEIHPTNKCYSFIPFLVYVKDDYSDIWNMNRSLMNIKKYYKPDFQLESKDENILEQIDFQQKKQEKKELLKNILGNKKTIDYDKINELTNRVVGYDVKSSKKPPRTETPQKREEINELRKDSLAKIARDFSKIKESRRKDLPNIFSKKR